MPQITIKADTASVVASMNQFTAALQQADDRIAKVTSSVAVFNAAGYQIGATIKGLTKAGEEFTAVLGLVDKKSVEAGISLQRLDFKTKAKDVDDLGHKTDAFHTILNRVGRNLVQFASYRSFGAARAREGRQDGHGPRAAPRAG
jgi:hypothetical protein